MHYVAAHGFHVNVSFTYYAYDGDNGTDCEYGGVAFYNANQHSPSHTKVDRLNISEITTVCTSKLQDRKHLQNMYSKENTLLVVAYSFKHLSFLDLKLTARKTSCLAIRLNPCELQRCFLPKVVLGLCDTKRMGEAFGFQPRKQSLSFKKREKRVSLKLATDRECFVVQISKNVHFATVDHVFEFFVDSFCELVFNIWSNSSSVMKYTLNSGSEIVVKAVTQVSVIVFSCSQSHRRDSWFTLKVQGYNRPSPRCFPPQGKNNFLHPCTTRGNLFSGFQSLSLKKGEVLGILYKLHATTSHPLETGLLHESFSCTRPAWRLEKLPHKFC